MSRCPASPDCPYCDDDGEHERLAEEANLDALIEAHLRAQTDEDCDSDTHPKDGDVKQAPLVSGAGLEEASPSLNHRPSGGVSDE